MKMENSFETSSNSYCLKNLAQYTEKNYPKIRTLKNSDKNFTKSRILQYNKYKFKLNCQ